MQNIHTDETAAADMLIVLQGNFATLDFLSPPHLPSPRDTAISQTELYHRYL